MAHSGAGRAHCTLRSSKLRTAWPSHALDGKPNTRRQPRRRPACLPLEQSHAGTTTPQLSVLDRPPAAASPTLPAAAPPSTASTSATTTPPPAPSAAAPPNQTLGYLSLTLVPILWGTYTPCIRYLYAEPDPLDPASLTAVRTVLSAGALLLPAAAGYLYRKGRDAWNSRDEQQQRQKEQAGSSDVGGLGSSAQMAEQPVIEQHHHTPLSATLAISADGAADGVAAAAVASAVEDDTAMGPDAGAAAPAAASGSAQQGRSLFSAPLSSARLGPVLTRTFDSVVLAGLELGFLNFLGTALQVEGLHSTSATRAGFLAELTAVLTPLVSYMAGYDIPRQMWLAVAVGLAGSTMVAYDTSQEAHATPRAAPQPPTTPTASAAPTAAPSPLIAPGMSSPDHAAGSGDVSMVAPAAGSNNSSWNTPGAQPVDLAGSFGAQAEGLAGRGVLDVEPVSASTAAALEVGVEAPSSLLGGSLAPAADLAVDLAAATGAVLNGADSTGHVALQAAAAAAGTAADPVNATAAVVEAATAAVAGSIPLEITGGEAYLLLACLFFSLCTVRMGIYAPRLDTVQLAAMKKVGLSSMSVMWMAASHLQDGASLGSVLSFPDLTSRTPLSVAVLLYSGLGPGALATFCQVKGLSTVPATTAQVIYSVMPLCTAFFAYLILGGEPTGPVAWAGGSLIIVAALMAAKAQYNQHQKHQQEQHQH